MNPKKAFCIYLLLSTAFLVAQAFQGLSFLDIGMYLSGYQHFNDEPYTTYYLGQWLLSYQFTGWLCRLLHADTFFALRLLHIALIVMLQTAIYLCLRRLIATRYIIAGLTLAVLAHFGSYLDISYNSYSSTLLVAIVLCYHRAVTTDRHASGLLLAAGMLTGIAFFFRAVNLTFLLLPPFALFVGRLAPFKATTGRQLTCFYGGTLIGTALIIGFETLLGTADILLLTAKDLLSIGGGADDPHSFKSIIIGAYTIYKKALAQAGILCILAGLTAWITSHVSNTLLRRSSLLLTTAFIVLNAYYWEEPSNIATAICLIGTVAVCSGNKPLSPAVSLLALSLFIPIVYPIGSNGGAAFVGPFLCFLPLPLSLWAISTKLKELRLPMTITYMGLCCALLFTNIMRPMMEDGNRLACRYAIDGCRTTNHIYTTAENATMYHLLLKEVKPQLPDGSYLLCNFSLPAISMLNCKPFAVFSDVFTNDTMTERYIATALSHTAAMPYLLLDHATIRPGFEHACEVLRCHSNYESVWKSDSYELLRPVKEH